MAEPKTFGEYTKARAKEQNIRGPLKSLEIRTAENGYEVTCTYDRKPGKKSGGPYLDDYAALNKRHVFESGEALLEFVEDRLSMMGATEAEDD